MRLYTFGFAFVLSLSSLALNVTTVDKLIPLTALHMLPKAFELDHAFDDAVYASMFEIGFTNPGWFARTMMLQYQGSGDWMARSVGLSLINNVVANRIASHWGAPVSLGFILTGFLNLEASRRLPKGEIRTNILDYKILGAFINAAQHYLNESGYSYTEAGALTGAALLGTGILLTQNPQNYQIGYAMLGEAGFRFLPSIVSPTIAASTAIPLLIWMKQYAPKKKTVAAGLHFFGISTAATFFGIITRTILESLVENH